MSVTKYKSGLETANTDIWLAWYFELIFDL